MVVIFPKTLKKGDKIAVVSPAGSVEEGQILSTLELIKSKGYEPVLSPHCLGRFSFGYSYSGTEKQRISDLNWALNNDEVSAIWATRGGYGCHLLEFQRKVTKGFSIFSAGKSLNIRSLHIRRITTEAQREFWSVEIWRWSMRFWEARIR